MRRERSVPPVGQRDETIRARRKAGATLQSIGDEFGISRQRVHHIVGVRTDKTNGTPLTYRELEVLGFVSRGMTNEEVGERLGIASGTVRTHRQNIVRRLHVHNSLAAVALALREEWIA
jgi:DNA-binding NarL/FixJ family response regulator